MIRLAPTAARSIRSSIGRRITAEAQAEADRRRSERRERIAEIMRARLAVILDEAAGGRTRRRARP